MPGRFVALVLLAGSLMSAPPVHGEELYAGKILTIVIGSDVGGAYDGLARLIGRRMSAHIPGRPTITYRNMPGASSRTAAAFLYNRAAKDGLSVGAIAPQALLEPLLGEARHVEYDPLKFELVGSAASLVYLCVLRTDAPAKSFAETLATEVVMGTSAPGGAGYDTMMALKRVVGAKFKPVTGYANSAATALAVARNEVSGACGGTDQINAQRDFAAQNGLRVIVQYGLAPDPRLTAMGAPPVWDFVSNPEDKALLQFLMAAQAFGRPYLMPPGTPPEAVAIIQRAFAATLADEEFLADAARANLDISPMPAAAMRGLLDKTYAASPELVARARAALQ